MKNLYVDTDIAKASPISSQFYTSPEWFDLSKEKVFSQTWQFCLSTDELKGTGQMVPHTLLPDFLNEPLRTRSVSA